ncbi:sporulation-delaying protein SdpB family protein [Curtobacterium sp. MCBA15_016]|uniref:sporulation-delaying protein SdpB family protein n=1 Tax=Curtobacterium sp. MCBA15_016 TaxID=1898740 RepID=UPI00111468EC|nr:sporulation-delaying protein SdpB family protein [Curtobacterium sp. MCBA15_016]
MTATTIAGACRRADRSRRTAWARYIAAVSPFSPVLGLVRSILAAAALLTLVLTPTDQLFFRSTTFPSGTNCANATSWMSLFCIGSSNGQLEPARWIAVVVLALVITGILPAVTALPHWWVTWSLMSSSTAVDGGEHLAANLTLILIPILLLDRRRWHWSRDSRYGRRSPWVASIAYAAVGLWVLQMMGVYFQASVAKFAVLEWSDGTALWYWMQNPVFAPPAPIGDVVRSALAWLPFTVVLTYGTLALQLALVAAVFLPQRARRLFLLLAVVFHLAIACLMGLWSFSMIMIAADILLLVRPHEATSLAQVIHWRLGRAQGAEHVSG